MKIFHGVDVGPEGKGCFTDRLDRFDGKRECWWFLST